MPSILGSVRTRAHVRHARGTPPIVANNGQIQTGIYAILHRTSIYYYWLDRVDCQQNWPAHWEHVLSALLYDRGNPDIRDSDALRAGSIRSDFWLVREFIRVNVLYVGRLRGHTGDS